MPLCVFLGANVITAFNSMVFAVFLFCGGLVSSLNASQISDLSVWKAELKKDAIARGISEATFDNAIADFTPIERIIKLDRNQPEFTQTLDHYLAKRVTLSLIHI